MESRTGKGLAMQQAKRTPPGASSANDPLRGQPLRRSSSGGEMHRVLIRIPDFRDPVPLAPPQPIPTTPLSQPVQTWVVHQAHSALQPHLGRGRSSPSLGPSTIIAAPPMAESPAIEARDVKRPSDLRYTSTTAAIDAVAGAPYNEPDAFDENDDEYEHEVQRQRRRGRRSNRRGVRRWVSQLDADDLHRIGSKLSLLARFWGWFVQPRIALTALGAFLLQMTGLAVVFEMQGTPATPTPTSDIMPPASAPGLIQTPLTTTGSSGVPPAAPSVSSPLPEGPLVPSIAPPKSASPIVTPANQPSIAPRFEDTRRLPGTQDRLPWEETPTDDKATVTPLVPEGSARRAVSPTTVGARSDQRTRLLGVELPNGEGRP